MTRDELKTWRRYHCAYIATGNWTAEEAADLADVSLDLDRKRVAEIDAAERERQAQREAEAAAARAEAEELAAREREQRIAEAEANKARVRAALNAAPWEPRTRGVYARFHGRAFDEVSMAGRDCQSIRAFGADGDAIFRRGEPWPSDMGNPPPGWDGGER